MTARLLPKRSLRFLALTSATALIIGVSSCSTPTAEQTTTTPTPGTQQAASPAPSGAAPSGAAPGGSAIATKLNLTQSVSLNGAGATFPAPLYQKWFQDINQANPKLKINYQGVGSGAGVQQFTQKTVDFGASDVAMKDEEIAKVSGDVLMLPMTAGGIVLAYNLPEVKGELKLSREAYVGIFLGKVTKWNDPLIAKANPDLKLPDMPIAVVHRSDGSGTTAVFTQHLSAINPEWKDKVGSGKEVNWPVGVGGKGNDGVTAQLKQTEGSIGYVEYGYAKQNTLTMASLEDKSGDFVAPSDESAAKTLSTVELPENLRAFITDPEGKGAYPIVTYTWLLVHKKYSDPEKAKSIEAMIEYGLTQGQQDSTALGYIPLPDTVKERVVKAAQDISPDYTISLK